MASKTRTHKQWLLLLTLPVLLLTLSVAATGAFAGRQANAPKSKSTQSISNPSLKAASTLGANGNSPQMQDAFLFFQPGTAAGSCPAPSNGGVTTVGCTFSLDLMLNAGTNAAPDGVTAQQSYLTFTYQIIQNTRVSSLPSCVPTSTVTADLSVFDASLQNEICNGPGACNFRGLIVDPGTISYANGALSNCQDGCPDTDHPMAIFRVAQMGICATSLGQASLYWQFDQTQPCSTGASRTRDTEIVLADGALAQDCSLFANYTFTVVGAATVTPTSTPEPSTNTPTSIPTDTPSNTPADTLTSTPIGTPSDTPTAIDTLTATSTPAITNTPTIALTRTLTRTPAATPCDVCSLYFVNTNISCNADGTVHWSATVRNNGRCTVNTPYKVQLQTRQGYNGQFVTRVQTREPNGVFPPGLTHIQGDLCYQFQPTDTFMRIYIALDSTTTRCNADHLSPFIDVCSHPGLCPTGPQFPDVPVGSNVYSSVGSLVSGGAITGYSDGTFRPGATTTRGQLAKIVTLAFGLTAVSAQNSTQHFSDVPTDSPFFGYIEAAYANGLISGYTDGTFRPGSEVTRAQVAKIVVQASGWTVVSPATATFSDVPAGSAYYSYVETAYANHVLSGYSDGTFRPGNSATRGQIAQITNIAATVQTPKLPWGWQGGDGR